MGEGKEWDPSLAFLIDLLSIVTLKSIILGVETEKKEVYEKEAREIMESINNKMSEGNLDHYGKFIRAVQISMLANRLIWENETKARLGGREQDHLLPLTHSINGLRMRAGNAIINQTGGRKDLNLDRLNDEICLKYGFNFSMLFNE
ncbi:MAG: hypothetical protein AABY22_07750 [Nanoarchaeota archaeon]